MGVPNWLSNWNRRYGIVVALMLVPMFSACVPAAVSKGSPQRQEVIVFAAASLTDAFTDLGQAFEQANEGAVVTLNFAGSQQLAQQLANGARADAFASANMVQMNVAVEAGRIDRRDIYAFATNLLVVVTPDDNPARIGTLTDLAQPGVKLVLADSAVPVGQYTLDFLARATEDASFPIGFGDAVLSNVVSYENSVRAVLAKVLLGEADAGIVYMSDIGGAIQNRVRMLPIPDELNTVAIYPIGPVTGGAQAELAQRFIDFLRSEVGQSILESYGFRGIE